MHIIPTTIAIVSSLLQQCNQQLFDVKMLMAVQLLIESIHNEMPSVNMEMLLVLQRKLVCNIHGQNLRFTSWMGTFSTIIKDDRKFFRCHFVVRYMFNMIHQSNARSMLYSRLFFFMLPFELEIHVILTLLDHNLASDTELGYPEALCFVRHIGHDRLRWASRYADLQCSGQSRIVVRLFIDLGKFIV